MYTRMYLFQDDYKFVTKTLKRTIQKFDKECDKAAKENKDEAIQEEPGEEAKGNDEFYDAIEEDVVKNKKNNSTEGICIKIYTCRSMYCIEQGHFLKKKKRLL